MDLECLAGVTLISELLGQSLDDVTQTVLESLVHLSKVSLLVNSILHLFDPLGEFVSKMVQSILEIIHSLDESIKSLLANTTTVTCRLRDLEIIECIVKKPPFLLKSCDASL